MLALFKNLEVSLYTSKNYEICYPGYKRQKIKLDLISNGIIGNTEMITFPEYSGKTITIKKIVIGKNNKIFLKRKLEKSIKLEDGQSFQIPIEFITMQFN